ncbi:MAG TPA: hypothetical protein VIM48_04785 [Chthoniobacterales bacterium]
MKMVIRALALVLLIATVGLWAGLGGTFEWTRVEHYRGADGMHQRVAPGIEFLAVGVGGSILIFAATLFVHVTPKT